MGVRGFVIGLALALSVAACGPIEYVNTVTRGANDAIAQARAANAAKWAPYYWTRAVEYQHEARVRAASADFQAANHFGQLAEDAARQATSDALRRSSNPDAAREIEIPTRPVTHETEDKGLAPVNP